MKKNLFVDRAKVTVVGGRGGNGASHFLREKFVPLGGPDGGDGGRGGHVILVGNASLKTLVDFSYRKTYAAEPGKAGAGKKRTGKQAKDSMVPVPVGTVVLTAGGEMVADIREHGQRVIVAKGGRGGRGNVHFATSLRRAPKLAEKGEPGESRDLVLELKLLADVGLVGLPNAGKSTLLAAVSAAHPKIADYPFTTLTPNLGRVKIDEGADFVLVDIPGLIAGASQGAGLGHEFLRHVERTRLLIHVVDAGFPGVDPPRDFTTINRELADYHARLARRRQLVALNKVDLVSKPRAAALKKRFQGQGYEVFLISAATRQGVPELMRRALAVLQTLPADEDTLDLPIRIIRGLPPRFVLEANGTGVWRLTGQEVIKWVAMTDFENEEAVDKLRDIFNRLGVSKEFKKKKVAEGDTIVVGKEEFLFREDL